MSTQHITPRSWHVGARTHRKRRDLVTTYSILDDHGSVIAELPEDVHSHEEQSENAELICNAVNRRDYLLDLVRRLAQRLQQARLEGFSIPNEDSLLREAAEATKGDAR